MMKYERGVDERERARWRAIAELHRAFFTGLILHLVARRSAVDATEFVFRVFRRQQQERFLPGLAKLGLTGLPHAVACAQYHYLSNWIGGVPVEYMAESDAKAWIRYPPPRWIWGGTAICGIPTSVSRAILRGWHAQNGVSLANPRLGFVCTKQAVDGQDGLEGFYCEYDHDLEPGERLVFAPHLEAPPFDPARAPNLPVDVWPQERLARAHRDYAMEYVRSSLPTAIALFGPDDATHALRFTGRLIGMQFGAETFAAFAMEASGDAAAFAVFLQALFTAQGDEATVDGLKVVQTRWRLMAGDADLHPAGLSALQGLVEGLAMAWGRGLAIRREPLPNISTGAIWHVR